MLFSIVFTIYFNRRRHCHDMAHAHVYDLVDASTVQSDAQGDARKPRRHYVKEAQIEWTHEGRYSAHPRLKTD